MNDATPVDHTLTDRYIDAVMRTVPEESRTDLAAELTASIGDQIDARVEAGEERRAAERAVLTDLGEPDRLAAGYTERPLHLIGPRFFLTWWRLLKLLLWIVLPCVAFGVALGTTLGGAGFGAIVGTTVVALLHTVVHLGFWTTLTFAIVERMSRRDAEALSTWSLDDLPERRESGAGRGDMVATLVFLVLGAGAVLWDQHIGFAPAHPGLSFLDPGLWPWWITGLLVIMALEAIVAIAVHAAGRWTLGLATAYAVLNVLVAVPAIWLLLEGRLLNGDFWPTLVDAEAAPTVDNVFTVLTGFGIAGVAIWSVVDAFLKTARSR